MKKRSLRFAFFCFSRARGGLELMLLKVAAALRQRNHHVVFVGPPQSLFEKECANQILPFFPLVRRFKYLDVLSASAIARLLEKEQIDVLLTGQSRDVSTAAVAARRYPKSRLVFFQQMQFGNNRRDLFHRWTYGHLDLWITLTEAMRQSVIDNTTVRREIIRVIPFGVDLSVFKLSRYNQAGSRKAFGLPKKAIIISLIGRFDKQKGQEYLLRAIPTVLEKTRNAHFVLVGEETVGEKGYSNELNRIVEHLRISERVTFLPFTQDVPRFLSACDLVTVPSFSETFGYVAVEAMAMGIPVIGTNTGGLPEIVVDGKTGLLVPPRDSRALAEAIIRLAVSTKLRTVFGKAGRARVETNFDFARNLDDFENACSELLPRHS